MKLTLESTEKIVELVTPEGKVPARVWQGQSGAGVDVICYITRIAVRRDAENSQFERELQETPHTRMSDDVRAIPTRLIL